ncbi:MAG TPA: aspartyl protease family protein [Bryobacteraceae bacterium]|nr:aspartyl protease family protein [Bryobacteraceae bacterium]
MALPTSVNDSGNLLFLLDSGGSWSVIDADSTEKYTPERAAAGVDLKGVQGTVTGLDKARFVTLTFAGMRQKNAAMLTMDMESLSDDFGAQFGGILGMPILNQLAMTIDYRAGIVRFEHK